MCDPQVRFRERPRGASPWAYSTGRATYAYYASLRARLGVASTSPIFRTLARDGHRGRVNVNLSEPARAVLQYTLLGLAIQAGPGSVAAGAWGGWRAPRDPRGCALPQVPAPRKSARWFPQSSASRCAAHRPARFAGRDAPTSGTPARRFARGTPGLQ